MTYLLTIKLPISLNVNSKLATDAIQIHLLIPTPSVLDKINL